MKKLIIGLIVLAVSVAMFAINNGEIAASVASTTNLSVVGWPLDVTPVAISDGVGTANVLAVNDITISDNSLAGWTLTVTQTNFNNGRLVHTTAPATTDSIAYTLHWHFVSGTLGTGLAVAPTDGTALTFVAGVETIAATSVATSATDTYIIDFDMVIANGAVVDPLVGRYEDTLTLTIAGN
ncbi:MAG: hypothetical protein KKD38_04730 [Candidatus Delongbacteria bacterium]|nr:hypothetical protein [Candidatus Delongbacteria bacterium]MCG2761295.1 hypothetical protein [Candidatus Delongbacteria bacterium]